MSLGSRVLDWIYPSKCGLCGCLSSTNPCRFCVGEMERIPDPVRRFPGEPLAVRAAIYTYEGRAAQAVRRVKYSRHTGLAAWMAEQMRISYGHLIQPEDVVIPVPIHWKRRFHRGFNQSELLAEAFASSCQVESLMRLRSTKPQVGLTYAERLTNLEGAFEASPDVRGKVVYLVDDVITSGGTALACAEALRSAGAKEVGALAFAGTL